MDKHSSHTSLPNNVSHVFPRSGSLEMGFGSNRSDFDIQYLPFSGGYWAPFSREILFRKELCWRLNSPVVSPGLTQSVILLPSDEAVGVSLVA